MRRRFENQGAVMVRSIRQFGIRLACLCLCASTWAQAELGGTWQGTLNIGPDVSLVVQFVFENADDGSVSAVLNAPDEASLRDIPVTKLELDGNALSMRVAKVNGTYEGVVGDGIINGQWKQQGTSFPLDLAPYEEAVLSDAVKDHLRGPWFGKLKLPNLPDPIALGLRFETNDQGEFVAFLDSPDQGALGIVVDDLSVNDNKISVTVLEPRMVYIATIDGDRMVGEFTQRNAMALTLDKGEYQVPGIDVAAPLRERLLGAWHGQLENTLTIELQFTEEEDGRFVGLLDSPDQGRFNFPIFSVESEDERYQMEVKGIGATLTGRFEDGRLVGRYTQGGQQYSLSLERGPFLGHVVEASPNVLANLQGTWDAQTANTTFEFRFEEQDDSQTLAFLDIPSNLTRGLPITEFAATDEGVSFIVKGIEAEFAGRIDEGKMTGQWTMPDLIFPIDIVKRVN